MTFSFRPGFSLIALNIATAIASVIAMAIFSLLVAAWSPPAANAAQGAEAAQPEGASLKSGLHTLAIAAVIGLAASFVAASVLWRPVARWTERGFN